MMEISRHPTEHIVAYEGTRIWRICGVARPAVLVPSPYAYQKASWLVPAR
jgi:hypothetical protein